MVSSGLLLLHSMSIIDVAFKAVWRQALIIEGNTTKPTYRHLPSLEDETKETRYKLRIPETTEDDTGENFLETQDEFPRVGPVAEHLTSVHHFARHGLCHHFNGQKHLYVAMKTKICGLSSNFIANHVMTMCQHKDVSLDMWVSALFDTDDDGTVTHYERNLYT